jgi:hypothetical protein
MQASLAISGVLLIFDEKLTMMNKSEQTISLILILMKLMMLMEPKNHLPSWHRTLILLASAEETRVRVDLHPKMRSLQPIYSKLKDKPMT